MIKDIEIELSSILSNRTKEGMVELRVDDEVIQMDIRKAKEVCQMLHEAIEAAASDTIIYRFLTERIKLPEEKAVYALRDFRELRHGTNKANKQREN